MKKNILFGIGFIMLFYGNINGAFADTFIRSEFLPYAGQDPIATAKKIAEKRNNLSDQIDFYLNYLLKIPFEQRQYIFPALFDIPNIPKKIRTHPEIAIWEGKMPTDIAPEKRVLADKYMKDLNPAFYVYLVPKDRSHEEIDSPNKNDGTLLLTPDEQKVTRKSPKYPTIYEALTPTDDLQKNPDSAILTPSDIEKIDSGLAFFNRYLKEIQNNPHTFKKYQLLSQYYTDPDKERINPFQAKTERLKLIKQIEKLDQGMQKIGFKSAEDFSVKADALVKAYRAARMSYGVVLQARRYKNITPKNKTEKLLTLTSEMHKAYPKDAQLVLDNSETVRQIFIKNGYQSVLDAETFDVFRN